MSLQKRFLRFKNKQIVLRWWSLKNWLKGYKYGPVQRFRCCDHTTPNHYLYCSEMAA